MNSPDISIFPNIGKPTQYSIMNIEFVLDQIQQGEYMSVINRLRNEKDKEKQKKIKLHELPTFTAAGVFHRKANDAYDKKRASGLIIVDFDGFETTEAAEILRDAIAEDEYCYAAFLSCRGKGVAAICRVEMPKDNEDNHLLYKGICAYYADLFEYISADPSGGDVSRGRQMSWDPRLKRKNFQTVKVWRKRAEPPKKSETKTISKYQQIAVRTCDVENICAQITERGLALLDDYPDYMATGFAFARKLGEAGREYFVEIASLSGNKTRCKPHNASRAYDGFLKHSAGEEGKISWGSFIKLCKDNGIEVQTDETKTIISRAISQKRTGVPADDCIKNLEKHDRIAAETATELVKSVYASEFVADPNEKVEPLIASERWIKTRDFKFNEFVEEVEFEGNEISEIEMNSLYFECLQQCFAGAKKISISDFEMQLKSKLVQTYNPVKDFFKDLECVESSYTHPKIKELVTKMRLCEPSAAEFAERMLTKWLVQIVAITFEEPTDIMLVLAGSKGMGKSFFFKNILPKKLQKYVATFRLAKKSDSADKDNLLLLCKNLLVYVDDADIADLRSDGKLKDMITSETITARAVFGRKSKKYVRRAMVAANTNEEGFIENATENRRIVPFELQHRIFESLAPILLNEGSENWKREFWAEVYQLYLTWKPKKHWLLSEADISELESWNGAKFQNFAEKSEFDRIFEQGSSSEFLDLAQIAHAIALHSRSKVFLNMNLIQLGKKIGAFAKEDQKYKKVSQRKGWNLRVKFDI